MFILWQNKKKIIYAEVFRSKAMFAYSLDNSTFSSFDFETKYDAIINGML